MLSTIVPSPETVPVHTSLAQKLAEAALAAIATVNALLMALEMVPREWQEKFGDYEALLLAVPLVVGLLAGVVLAIRWHRRERREGPALVGARWHARLQGILRYWLAFEIATYGFAKLLQTQFETANYQLDRPLGAVTGFTLTWYYFGYSRTFAVILGLIQIGGAALLLWRRTTLLGALVLLPVMVNIVFINLFYDIAFGAFLNSALFTLGLSFLIGLDWPKLRAALFALTETLPAVHLGGPAAKTALRLIVLLLPAAFIWYLKSQNGPPSPLDGVWRVDSLTRAGQPVPLDSCGTAEQGWTRFYFAGWHGAVVRFAPDKYEPNRELRGKYVYDATRHQLRAAFATKPSRDKNPEAPGDSLLTTVVLADPRHARLRGTFGQDSVVVALTKLRD